MGAADALPVCDAVRAWLGVQVEVGLAVPLRVCESLGVDAALLVLDALGENVLESVELGDRVTVALLETVCEGVCIAEGVGLALGDCVSEGVAPLLLVTVAEPVTLRVPVSEPDELGLGVAGAPLGL